MPSYHQAQSCDLQVNDRAYTVPDRPVAVLSLEGFSDEYITAAHIQRQMPHLGRLVREGGFRGMARGVVPAVALANHAAILSGAPASTTGITGNSFLDPDTGEEGPMDRPELLRCDTILAAAAAAGRKVALVTAREHGRRMLAKDLKGISFSAERAREATAEDHGITGVESMVGRRTPGVDGPEASLFALEAAAILCEEKEADFVYLSLSDWIPHRHAPWEQASLEFLRDLDEGIGHLLRTGAVLGIVAPYGTHGKDSDGSPTVQYLGQALAQEFGDQVRVSRPVADPYASHHLGLSGCAMLHLGRKAKAEKVRTFVLGLDGVDEVLPAPVAAAKLELPQDRTGDLLVLAARGAVLGLGPEDHDLTAAGHTLRSHGSRHESLVPFLLSRPVPKGYAHRAASDLRSFDLFQFLCPPAGA